ncbi:MAG: hypothetical protein D6824_00350 [Planctomycetota bacterium]|nr:MAG: hypothetical protein D6824_00350 [Planctomycetota bacterium]
MPSPRSDDPPPASPQAEASCAGFDAYELAAVLSHYDLGVIEAIHPFPRGSPASPKALIRAEKGRFLLKRRREGASSLERILFAHRVQLQLAERGFPLPRLVGTQVSNASVLERQGALYEVFVFVPGSPFDGSEAQARAAGACLAQLHAALSDFPTQEAPSDLLRGFHDREDLPAQLAVAPAQVSKAWRLGLSERAELDRAAAWLATTYAEAAKEAEAAGVSQWPRQVVHGDFHGGNLLFTPRGEVAAALDYDSVRIEPRVMDLANGALQLSLTRGGDALAHWPAELDLSRLRAFLSGYDGPAPGAISQAETAALPWLMIEALIVEAAAPVAATGSFAKLEGGAFIRMIERKVQWLHDNAHEVIDAVG